MLTLRFCFQRTTNQSNFALVLGANVTNNLISLVNEAGKNAVCSGFGKKCEGTFANWIERILHNEAFSTFIYNTKL
ncbi:hypothetical protein L3Y34_012480 [Caenorhabditis briggsae]|uniref:Uncharacterized protein n=1 Tax=Caenorhabditis briggsae TaxID=6238 RepID=A0AAE8ZZ36_CAEBR|nr:hypothetical protein L3Y34_012480 [Caenorhabditis briggsae]